MYGYHVLPCKSELANEPLGLPIHALLVLPDDVTLSPGEALFNLPGAINELMGGAGWERAVQVISPYVWAPQWNDEQFREFVAGPFGQNKRPFPPMDPPELRPSSPSYEIIHFVGNILKTDSGYQALVFGNGRERGLVYGENLYSRLRQARTRLLILQNLSGVKGQPPEEYFHQGLQLAESIVSAGGPAVLVVAGGDAIDLSKYFLDLYGNIIHNYPLPEAARPNASIEKSLMVVLFVADGGEEMLLFNGLIDDLYNRAQSVDGMIHSILKSPVKSVLDQMRPFLHRSQILAYEDKVSKLDEEISQQASQMLGATRDVRRELDFSRETRGAIPLAENITVMASIEAESARLRDLHPQTITDLRDALHAEATTAARVLNAAFANPTDRCVLGSRDPLIAGQEYDFLIDVGPSWNTVQSLVIGNKEFPESALPPTEDEGYPIHVILISDDTEPKLFSGWIWVPRHTGRSLPYDTVKQQKAGESGPISFRIKAPSLDDADEHIKQLRGRLCLYYRNNLLQSAIVRAAVVRTPEVVLEVDNVVEVDYVLSGTVQELDRFATRELRFTEKDEIREHPIAVNITLNDDGGNGHRVLVRQLDGQPSSSNNDSPVGWTPYDPAAAYTALERARDILKSCFYLRNEGNGEVILNGVGEPVIGLGTNNGKTKNQFLWDLLILAKLGSTLFDSAFGQVKPAGKWDTLAQWTRALQQTLETSSIIQVARTAPANYVFPWGLIYKYPLPGPNDRLKFCRVTSEWAADGSRTKPLASSCPYKGESWHVENVVCPYGFWGLNHIIEQPLSALRKLDDGTYVLGNATDKILVNSSLDLSVGVTHDVSKSELDAHLTRLSQIQPMRINPQDPADNMDKVRAMLKATTMVYFLCHGEYDDKEKEPYLGIGLRDNDPIHRLYPKLVQSWARTADLEAWQNMHPLVFINGCHTANLKPGEVLNFVTAFNFAGASGVIGTEVSVLVPLATEISELLFEKIALNMPIGQAMYEIRWQLANKGNLLGMAYTLYCLANLHVTKT